MKFVTIILNLNVEVGKAMFYDIVLFIHVLTAIGSIGPLFAMFFMLKRMKNIEESKLLGVIEGLLGAIRTVEVSGHWLVPSGVVLILLGPWKFTTSWVLATIVLLLLTLIYLAKAFKPAKRLIGTERFTREQFIQSMKKATFFYSLIMLTLLWLMVAKPVLW